MEQSEMEMIPNWVYRTTLARCMCDFSEYSLCGKRGDHLIDAMAEYLSPEKLSSIYGDNFKESKLSRIRMFINYLIDPKQEDTKIIFTNMLRLLQEDANLKCPKLSSELLNMIKEVKQQSIEIENIYHKTLDKCKYELLKYCIPVQVEGLIDKLDKAGFIRPEHRRRLNDMRSPSERMTCLIFCLKDPRRQDTEMAFYELVRLLQQDDDLKRADIADKLLESLEIVKTQPAEIDEVDFLPHILEQIHTLQDNFCNDGAYRYQIKDGFADVVSQLKEHLESRDANLTSTHTGTDDETLARVEQKMLECVNTVNSLVDIHDLVVWLADEYRGINKHETTEILEKIASFIRNVLESQRSDNVLKVSDMSESGEGVKTVVGDIAESGTTVVSVRDTGEGGDTVLTGGDVGDTLVGEGGDTVLKGGDVGDTLVGEGGDTVLKGGDVGDVDEIWANLADIDNLLKSKRRDDVEDDESVASVGDTTGGTETDVKVDEIGTGDGTVVKDDDILCEGIGTVGGFVAQSGTTIANAGEVGESVQTIGDIGESLSKIGDDVGDVEVGHYVGYPAQGMKFAQLRVVYSEESEDSDVSISEPVPRSAETELGVSVNVRDELMRISDEVTRRDVSLSNINVSTANIAWFRMWQLIGPALHWCGMTMHWMRHRVGLALRGFYGVGTRLSIGDNIGAGEDTTTDMSDQASMDVLQLYEGGSNAALVSQAMLSTTHRNVNAVNNNGQTLLMLACRDGNFNIVNALLNDDITNVNMRDIHGRNALFYSILGDDQNVITLMISSDVNIYETDNDGFTYPWYVLGLDVVNYLLNAWTGTFYDNSFTKYVLDTFIMPLKKLTAALHRPKIIKIVSCLLRVDVLDHTELLKVILLAGQDDIVHSILHRGNVRLHQRNQLVFIRTAIISGSKKTLKVLLEYLGINLDFLSAEDVQAIMVCGLCHNRTCVSAILLRYMGHLISSAYKIALSFQTHKIDALPFILKSYNVSAMLNTKDRSGNTVFALLCKYGSPDLVEALLEHCEINFSECNYEMISPFMMALRNKSKDVAIILLRHPKAKVDVNHRDSSDISTLGHAAMVGNMDIVRLLVSHPSIVLTAAEREYIPTDATLGLLSTIIDPFIMSIYNKRLDINPPHSPIPRHSTPSRQPHSPSSRHSTPFRRSEIPATPQPPATP